MKKKLIKDIVAGGKVSGWAKLCLECKGLFIGPSDAKYCSDLCRQRGWRKRTASDADKPAAG